MPTWTGSWGSRRSRRRLSAQEDGKVVIPTHRPRLPPKDIPGVSASGWAKPRAITHPEGWSQMNNPIYSNGNRTLNLLACSTVSLTASPGAPQTVPRSDMRNSHTVMQRFLKRLQTDNWKYRHAPHNDVSVNDGPHKRRWSHKIIIL